MIRGWAQSTFRAFGSRDYAVLWLGTTFAFLGFAMSSVAQGVVAFDITGKNRSVGAVSIGMGLATIVVAPFGGVLADRLSKRLLLLLGQSTIGLTFFTVAVLIATDRITILWLAASTFVMGAVFSFIAPARQAWVGEILEGPILSNGIALQQLAMTLTRVFGPFAAGGLIALSFSGTAGTYFFMAGLFVLVVLTLARVPAAKPRPEAERSSLRGDLVSGVTYLFERPRLLLLSAGFVGFVVAGFSYQVLIPGYIENDMHRGPGTIGVLYGVSGLAGLGATVLLAGFSGSRHAFHAMLGLGAVVAAGLGVLAVAGSYLAVIAAMMLVGAGSSGYQLLNNSLLMQEADPRFFGRVMSVVMLAWGVNGLVAYPYGGLADAVGERETLMLMSLLVVAVTAATLGASVLLGRQAPERDPGIPAPAVQRLPGQ